MIYCLIINIFVCLAKWLGGELVSKIVYLVVEAGKPVEFYIIAGDLVRHAQERARQDGLQYLIRRGHIVG